MCSISLFFEIHALFEIMWENFVGSDRPQPTMWRMRIACWIPKATNTHTHTHTHSQYVIFIAFPPKQWLHERTSMLRYTYIGCRVIFMFLSTPLFEVIHFFFSGFPAKRPCALPSNPCYMSCSSQLASLHHLNGEVFKLWPQRFWVKSCLHPLEDGGQTFFWNYYMYQPSVTSYTNAMFLIKVKVTLEQGMKTQRR